VGNSQGNLDNQNIKKYNTRSQQCSNKMHKINDARKNKSHNIKVIKLYNGEKCCKLKALHAV